MNDLQEVTTLYHCDINMDCGSGITAMLQPQRLQTEYHRDGRYNWQINICALRGNVLANGCYEFTVCLLLCFKQYSCERLL